MNPSVLAGQKAPSVALSAGQRSSGGFVCISFVGDRETDQDQSAQACVCVCVCVCTDIFMCGIDPFKDF